MSRWDKIIEEKIRAAQEQGKFDNLKGKGQPLALDDNPFEDTAMQMAHTLLKDNGFRPDWLEDDLQLREKLAQARQAVARTRAWREAALALLGSRADEMATTQRTTLNTEWLRAVEQFRETLTTINRGITNLNLKVPSPQFQRMKLDIEAEVQKIID